MLENILTLFLIVGVMVGPFIYVGISATIKEKKKREEI
tara:strand:- start:339 stop:452 length:114 start_codon:yes stop_codon:yes gene_type:complete